MTTKLPRTGQRDGKRVLVVDDEPRMIGFIRMNLELEGHQVVEAHTGLEALEAVRTKLPDIVLLDIMMPGTLNGLEVCRQIKADHATRFTKVVLLTARVQASDKEAGLAAGADDYLMKPFSTLQVLETIYRMEAEA